MSANIRADVLLVDGAVQGAVFKVATMSGTRLLLSTARKRSQGGTTNSGWLLAARERISHQFVGGITERVGDFTVYRPPGVPPLVVGPPLTQEVPRDASTVLSLTKHAKLFCTHLALEVIEPLPCVKLGSVDKPVYHG
jgi:hypothetical protein